jgi:hypothetical protein
MTTDDEAPTAPPMAQQRNRKNDEPLTVYEYTAADK